MVLEEVDLHGAVGEVHHHGPARPEPGLQSRDTGQLVLLPNLEMKLTINYRKWESPYKYIVAELEPFNPQESISNKNHRQQCTWVEQSLV